MIRRFLNYSLLFVIILGSAIATSAGYAGEELNMSNDEWKEKLSAEQYTIMREAGTEAPFSSPLLAEKREGTFVCAACGAPLFSSGEKYDSGTGWPSFSDAHTENIGISVDYKLGYPRKEYHCAKCGGHLGHVFEDGPTSTGLRYCNNGLALNFIPDDE